MSSFSFSLLVVVFLLPLCALSSEPGLNDEVLGLIVFKADLQDPSSKLLAWNEDDDAPCHWPGVLCDPKTNLVSELSLTGFSLSGKIGVRGLLRLQSLKKLSLSKNNFSGPLSPEILRIESLRSLDLSENSLSGPIPDGFFSQCRSLRTLSLAHNSFSGPIPANVGSCLTLASMNLSSNQLSGVFPAGLWDLNALRMLDLSDNMLSGEVPVGMQRMFNLRSISLRGNRLSGVLPEDIGACLLLKRLDLGHNSFSGELPHSLQMLYMCQFLSLSSNYFDGEVPRWIGELRRLQFLDLSDNRFSGRVPDSISELTELKEIKLSGNGFTGSVPESMVACKSLTDVDFSRNSFTGGIPSWLFQSTLQRVLISENKLNDSLRIPKMKHSTITVLDLSGNAFFGVIPDEIWSIQSLQSLNLSHNALSGHIHASIGDLKSLEFIDFSHNLLNGSIPPEIGKLVSLQSLELSHNKLSGTLPEQLSDLSHLHSFNISHNLFSGSIPTGHFFDTIPASSLSDNPGLCGSAVHRACPAVLPKPIVLNPNSSASNNSTHKASPEYIGQKKTILSISTVIAICAAVVLTIGVIAVTVLNIRVRSTALQSAAPLVLFDDNVSRSETTEANSGKLVMFTGEPEFSAGAHAVLNKDCELGRGGFGTVYKSTLKDGKPVAIKKLTVSSMVKSQDEFEKVVKKLAKIRHPNLVALDGYYWTSSLQLLIYEFLSGGSLYKHLHENSASSTLSWRERFNTILSVATSLAHLHQLNIIHYNLKSSNVLIDGTGVAKVGDYGLAKLLPMLDRYVISSKIQSALGYMAPEFACRTVKITEKCDVYAFGVLILEIVTGRRPVEYMDDDIVVLCDVMREAMEVGKADEFLDRKLQGCVTTEELAPVIKLGLICTAQVPSNRPEMSEVVSILELISCSQGSQCAEIS